MEQAQVDYEFCTLVRGSATQQQMMDLTTSFIVQLASYMLTHVGKFPISYDGVHLRYTKRTEFSKPSRGRDSAPRRLVGLMKEFRGGRSLEQGRRQNPRTGHM